MGDHPSAAEQIAEVGRRCVEAAGVTSAEVLDVACGAGKATIPATTGAGTTASI